MPVEIRRLSEDEIARYFPKRGQMDLTEYSAELRQLKPGEGAEIHPDDLTQRAVKRRWGQAAKQLGYTLKWSRDENADTMRFQVREAPSSRSGDGRRTRRSR